MIHIDGHNWNKGVDGQYSNTELLCFCKWKKQNDWLL